MTFYSAAFDVLKSRVRSSQQYRGVSRRQLHISESKNKPSKKSADAGDKVHLAVCFGWLPTQFILTPALTSCKHDGAKSFFWRWLTLTWSENFLLLMELKDQLLSSELPKHCSLSWIRQHTSTQCCFSPLDPHILHSILTWNSFSLDTYFPQGERRG
jgi:hypothetical protein